MSLGEVEEGVRDYLSTLAGFTEPTEQRTARGYLTSHFQIQSAPHTHFKALCVYISIIKNQIPGLIHTPPSTVQSVFTCHQECHVCRQIGPNMGEHLVTAR